MYALHLIRLAPLLCLTAVLLGHATPTSAGPEVSAERVLLDGHAEHVTPGARADVVSQIGADPIGDAPGAEPGAAMAPARLPDRPRAVSDSAPVHAPIYRVRRSGQAHRSAP